MRGEENKKGGHRLPKGAAARDFSVGFSQREAIRDFLNKKKNYIIIFKLISAVIFFIFCPA